MADERLRVAKELLEVCKAAADYFGWLQDKGALTREEETVMAQLRQLPGPR